MALGGVPTTPRKRPLAPRSRLRNGVVEAAGCCAAMDDAMALAALQVRLSRARELMQRSDARHACVLARALAGDLLLTASNASATYL
jgi:hypothetical protein